MRKNRATKIFKHTLTKILLVIFFRYEHRFFIYIEPVFREKKSQRSLSIIRSVKSCREFYRRGRQISLPHRKNWSSNFRSILITTRWSRSRSTCSGLTSGWQWVSMIVWTIWWPTSSSCSTTPADITNPTRSSTRWGFVDNYSSHRLVKPPLINRRPIAFKTSDGLFGLYS